MSMKCTCALSLLKSYDPPHVHMYLADVTWGHHWHGQGRSNSRVTGRASGESHSGTTVMAESQSSLASATSALDPSPELLGLPSLSTGLRADNRCSRLSI
eukprot:gnl/TRDRNA2_/TRDRNA2_161071_c0_seq2.p1 gnl/TRDRNA2_/TRDRNA2_161071_c0~~gnl/TRDRNA2_/TRDRNA2_161071_c0_seq2.p1  ORF type:complete len:100 (+),score=7.08 gnl/TRDRNA2_/TRDRNA2_161071_c0_seq2:2-301(+)